MPDIVASKDIDGLYVVTPEVHGDERGVFIETFRREWVPGAGEMVQANRADRQVGCFVGMHFHLRQADFWHIPFGDSFVVFYDMREGSPTEGGIVSMMMGPDHEHPSVYIPPGVAHGFWAVTDMTITYFVDQYYNPADEHALSWKDPGLVEVDWPGTDPILSNRDRSAPVLADVPDEIRPRWPG